MADPGAGGEGRARLPEGAGGRAGLPYEVDASGGAGERAGRLWIPVAACAVLLLGGLWLKHGCTQIPWDGHQYSRLCYNDIQALFEARGVADGTFPYVHGSLRDGELVGGAIEYPVLTGTFMWATGRLASDWRSYLEVSALFLAPFGLATAYLLARMSGPRALLWAGAPALVLYAFHNWDLLAVAAATGAFYCRRRGRPLGAAALLGIGAALKLYPLLFLVPLALERLLAGGGRASGRRAGGGRAGGGARAAAETLAVGLGVAVVINLPFALAGGEGWLATYLFHSRRVADFNSVWTWGAPSLAGDPPALNALVAGLSAASFALALWLGVRRAARDASFPFVAVSAAMLASFLLWTKVHSPQYALWILPFFVLLEVRMWWWVAYSLVDVSLYVAIFRWFADLSRTGDVETMTAAKTALVSAVWGRAALLGLLFFVFLRAEESDPAPAVVQATAHEPQARLSPG